MIKVTRLEEKVLGCEVLGHFFFLKIFTTVLKFELGYTRQSGFFTKIYSAMSQQRKKRLKKANTKKKTFGSTLPLRLLDLVNWGEGRGRGGVFVLL